MKRWTNLLPLASILLAVLLLAACAPAVPGPAPEEIEGQVATAVAQTIEAQGEVATSVAMTVDAQSTQTVASIPSQTNTPAAAATFEPAIIITDTPLASDTPSLTLPPPVVDESTPTITVTPEKYKCDAYTQAPKDREEVRPGEKFRIKWIIVNTGTRPLPAGVDVKYSGGSQMTSVTRVEIPNGLQPGESYTLVLDAVAPKEKGLQYMTWTVEGPLCFAYLAIEVK